MVDVAAAVARWTNAFAEDPVALGACYAPDASTIALDGESTIDGREAIVVAAERFATQVPDRRWITTTVLSDPMTGSAMVEGEVTGRAIDDLVTMTTPSLRWWRLDAEGLITEERSWFDWSARRIREPLLEGAARPVAPPAGTPHSLGWYRDLADRFAETWSWEPVLAVRSFCADDVVWTDVANPDEPLVGIAALEASEAERLGWLPRPHRRMTVVDVLGDGAVMAMLLQTEGRVLPPPGDAWGEPQTWWAVAVASLDSSDRASTVRWYGQWRTPVV